ncbi:MAG: CPBP family glutamic-type intramembrane protease [Terracidiphilus sp.]|jgi:hypothetical protein
MPPSLEVSSLPVLINRPEQIRERVKAGRIPWAGPLLLAPARTVLWLTFQCLLALIFLALHRPAPFREAGSWWIIYGTLVDICCLLGMRYFTRREGIRLRDLIGPIRMRCGRDVWIGLAILAVSYPLCFAGGQLAGRLVYGSMSKVPMAFVLQRHALPLWAMIYSVAVWWVIQSATEEMTYNGYVLPRLQALSGRTWPAIVITGFWFTAQHCMFPFIPDWRYIAFHFLLFIPLLLFVLLVYLRIRRLSPLILAHWPMDIGVAIMTGIW